MPLIKDRLLKAYFPLNSGNFNTVYSHLARGKHMVEVRREELTLSDGDFIDIDWVKNENERVIIVLHGLEGSSQSHYAQYLAKYFFPKGWDILLVNYRGCSGRPNRKLQMYHSGATYDVHEVMLRAVKDYDTMAAIGISLGANLLFKYLGEELYDIPKQLQAGVGVSAPVDLESCSVKISNSKYLPYNKWFLKSLREKIIQKNAQFPGKVDLDVLDRVITLIEFDDRFTAPLHGFTDAVDYYTRSSSKQFLKKISRPALLITSWDDPFLTPENIPIEEAKASDHFHMIANTDGGHVGFSGRPKNYLADTIRWFFEEYGLWRRS